MVIDPSEKEKQDFEMWRDHSITKLFYADFQDIRQGAIELALGGPYHHPEWELGLETGSCRMIDIMNDWTPWNPVGPFKAYEISRLKGK